MVEEAIRREQLRYYKKQLKEYEAIGDEVAIGTLKYAIKESQRKLKAGEA